jgi:hypothetical protein
MSCFNFSFMFRVLLIPLLTVLGDMCQDYCIERLGEPACSKGSYCKNNYDCHDLFWTTEEKTAICVFSSAHGECFDTFPVLCREVGSPSIRRSEPVSTTLHFRGYPFDVKFHPYVKLSFEDDDRNLGFFAMFDTGSDISTVIIESRDHIVA